MTLKEYFAEAGTRFTDKDANVIGPEIDRIFGSRIPHPDLIIQEASAVTSPLHSYFEWDDSSAAKKYRIAQARGMVRAIQYRIVERTAPEPARPAGIPLHVPAQVRAAPVSSIRVMPVAQKSEALTCRDIEYRAIKELEVWTNKYREYCNLYDLLKESMGPAVESVQDVTAVLRLARREKATA